MTSPPATHPASYCPDAAHTLQWGVRPGTTTQGWILARQHDDVSSVVAALDGYPNGRPPVPAGEAREWADRILGAAQGWVEQPAGSGAYHRHGTVAASPGVALNSTPDPQPDRSHRTVLAVTVTSRPDGGHYIDQADFTAHVAQWLKTDLKGHHAIDQVTVDDQAAELSRAQGEAHQYRTALQGVARKAAAPVAAPPSGQAGLRDQIVQAIADALKPRYGGPQHNTSGGLPLTATAEELRLHRAQPLADAVLPLLPATDEPHRLALSDALGLGTSAPWDAIRERAAELHQAQQPECALCGHRTCMLGKPCGVIATERGDLAERCGCTGGGTQQPETQGEEREWCKCRSCWGWFVEEHPGEDLDELGRDLGWWSGLPEHRDAPAGVSQPEIVHGCPPDGSGLTPCCGRTPFELPLGDRISSEAPVTCTTPPAVTLPGKEA